jgi:glutathione S-transferase
MIYPALVTILALFMYIWVLMNVAGARKRTGIQPPAVTGNDEFERCYRVQMNTLEQIVIFFPALWLCAVFFRYDIAAILGLGWIVGRVLYALGYYKATEKRHLGFLISFLSAVALLLLALWGCVARKVIH